jgi:hypothetical protein
MGPVYLVLTFCLMFVLALAIYTFKKLGRGWSVKALFKEFNRKMWMTLSLGLLFFTLYLLTVALGSHLVRQWGTDFFFLVYRHPVAFIYGGLWLFAFLSLSIYLVRMFIKYLYLTRGKDS